MADKGKEKDAPSLLEEDDEFEEFEAEGSLFFAVFYIFHVCSLAHTLPLPPLAEWTAAEGSADDAQQWDDNWDDDNVEDDFSKQLKSVLRRP